MKVLCKKNHHKGLQICISVEYLSSLLTAARLNVRGLRGEGRIFIGLYSLELNCIQASRPALESGMYSKQSQLHNASVRACVCVCIIRAVSSRCQSEIFRLKALYSPLTDDRDGDESITSTSGSLVRSISSASWLMVNNHKQLSPLRPGHTRRLTVCVVGVWTSLVLR